MMNQAMADRISDLKIKKPQKHLNMTVFPLVADDIGDPEHEMLADALNEGFLTVEEISEGGSVPDLLVDNKSDHFVLLLDGEEVAGAKQNRVLNTSILLDKRSKTPIPVSCTESGRWAYNSKNFSSSGNIMSSKIRRRKSGSMSESLKSTVSSYASDQGGVWAGIEELHEDACTHSPTSAMKDVFESREADLKKYEEALRPVPGQVGFFAFIDGKPAGCDLFSRNHSFKRVFDQLGKSYAIDALVSRKRKDDAVVKRKDAEVFLKKLPELKEDAFDSVGIGKDYRYEGESIIGSALIAGKTPVHASFFMSDEDPSGRQTTGGMSSLSRRRRARRYRSGEED
jgi:hypothetical protein